MIIEEVSLYEAVWQFAAIFWRFVFASIPPPNYWGGYGCFVGSLFYIGCVTLVIGEIATLLGCVSGIKDSITAITIVALGTSLPDTFASMTAAKTSDYADAAIGNVTGSNSVNVFLGLGLPWSIASSYHLAKYGKPYKVPAGDLTFSVFIFLICAIVCFCILIIRRRIIGGELGGPNFSKYASAVLCISLWVIYILMSCLQAYKVIEVDLMGRKEK